MGKLILNYGDILDYIDKADAIVNSNNQYMLCGSGVCGVIYKKAGKEELERYCRDNFKEPMKVNEVRITNGFYLGIDIIHIYCPKAYESKEPINELKQSYINILKEAKEKNYKNIVSVSLGTGVHGYKHTEVAKEIVNIINELASQYDINFKLVLPNEEIMEMYK